MVVEQREVTVLAHLDGADLVFHSDLNGGVQRDHPESLVLTHPTIFHSDRRLLVEPADPLARVGVHAHDDTPRRHDGHVVGDGVEGFDLVGPIIRERRGVRPVYGHLLRDLVALQHVLERVDPEAEVLGDPHEHQDLITPVRVGVDQDVSRHDIHEGFQTQVPSRLDAAVLSVRLPAAAVLLGPREPRAERIFHTHS